MCRLRLKCTTSRSAARTANCARAFCTRRAKWFWRSAFIEYCTEAFFGCRPKSLAGREFRNARRAGEPVLGAKLAILRVLREETPTNFRWSRNGAAQKRWSLITLMREFGAKAVQTRGQVCRLEQAQCGRTASAVNPIGCRFDPFDKLRACRLTAGGYSSKFSKSERGGIAPSMILVNKCSFVKWLARLLGRLQHLFNSV
jgi:hypothetical protein